MPDTRSPISRTEIAMRVRGIIADTMGRTPGECREGNTVAGSDMDDIEACTILSRVEFSFGIILGSDGEKTFMRGTIGQFIDLVEGQVRAAGCIS